MTEPEGSAHEQEASTSSAGDTPVEPVEALAESTEPSAEPFDELKTQLAERTLDLQRLQAEYVNYKRRVDRDRELIRAQGEASVLQSMLTVLDDLGRAAEHGELQGGFKAVGDAIWAAVGKHKLEAFGAKGEAFDPSMHEAVFHAGESADVETTTIDSVLRTGYRVGDRVLRAATVGVVDPATSPESPESPESPVEPVETESPESPVEPVETDTENS